MKVTGLKNIMKEVNEPNEFELFADNLDHPYYWIFKVDGVRVKTLAPQIEHLIKHSARFDVFINGLFISENDYVFDNKQNNFYIKFIKTKFPDFDRFGNPYELDETDEVKINGDLEKFV